MLSDSPILAKLFEDFLKSLQGVDTIEADVILRLKDKLVHEELTADALKEALFGKEEPL